MNVQIKLSQCNIRAKNALFSKPKEVSWKKFIIKRVKYILYKFQIILLTDNWNYHNNNNNNLSFNSIHHELFPNPHLSWILFVFYGTRKFANNNIFIFFDLKGFLWALYQESTLTLSILNISRLYSMPYLYCWIWFDF